MFVIFAFGIFVGVKSYKFIEKTNDEHPIIYITRYEKDDNAIYGKIRFYYKFNPVMYYTIENEKYVIPDGTYELENTYSVKFGETLPLIKDVPGRAGIRIHQGLFPEHSKGCILVSNGTLNKIMKFIYRNNANGKKTYVCIKTLKLQKCFYCPIVQWQNT